MCKCPVGLGAKRKRGGGGASAPPSCRMSSRVSSGFRSRAGSGFTRLARPPIRNGLAIRPSGGRLQNDEAVLEDEVLRPWIAAHGSVPGVLRAIRGGGVDVLLRQASPSAQ